MAKWGEGDPRWIVEERPDATNVNNWHWTEKNACQWSKEKLKELLVGLKLDNKVGKCKVTELSKSDGDASANNRKAKIIVFYEWELRMKWKAKVPGEDESIEGTIEIPNLSDENTVDDLDIQFLTEATSKAAQLMKEALRADGTPVVKAALQNYIDALKREFTQGMILPSKEQVTSSVNKLSDLRLDSVKDTGKNGLTTGGKNSGVKLDLCNLKSSTSMKCTAIEAFNALTRPEMFAAFTNGSGRIEPKVGGTFEMFGGNVHGKILDLKEPTVLVQEWRLKEWPDGHFSKVAFTILEKDDSTDITIEQTGIPKSALEKTKEGWERYYWDAMKRTFGFGSFII
ncbi:unnamed protein product [Orchesella dallaii]|uniref:Activator of Hsp90 ATPase AHSA1-like N-terminal domain-containing protein n=1 Tax=Orchesella dallaii TaxID=48710 RepID=A0ABP1QHL2_9HEXA